MNLPLQRPRFFTRIFIYRLAFLALVCAMVGGGDLRSTAVFFAAVTLLIMLLRRLRLARTAPALVLEDDTVLLPRDEERSSCDQVPYAQVIGVAIGADRRGEVMVVHTAARAYYYAVASLQHKEALPAFLEAFAVKLARTPESDAMRREFYLRENAAHSLREQPLRITWFILGAIGLVYLAEMALHIDADPLMLVRLGANAPQLVREGQWWRLFSASLLHGPPIHFILNALSLLSLGSLLERVLGRPGFWLVYLVSAVMGSVVSMGAMHTLPSVGASGAIFGLFGALLAVHLRYGDAVPAGVRQPQSWWFLNIGLNVGLAFAIPQIDWRAHAGGFIAGALVTFVLSAFTDFASLRERPQASTLVLAGLGLVFASASVFMTGRRMGDLEASRHDRSIVASALIDAAGRDKDSTYAGLLNNIAWSMAIDPDANESELGLAEAAADRALMLVGAGDDVIESSVISDTLATIVFRRGEHGRALDLERQALAESEKAMFAATVAKFAEAQALADGPTLQWADTLRLVLPAQALTRCETFVAARLDADGKRIGGVVAYLGKGSAGAQSLHERVGAHEATSSPSANERLRLLMRAPCSSAEERLVGAYFSSLEQ